jgi:RsiW-degrading membrane proteinase PrsW (M82 family)
VALSTFSILLLFAFIPPILFVIWFRNTERFEREPWRYVFKAFLWGAVIGVLVGVLLSLILSFAVMETVTFLQHVYVRLAEVLERGPSLGPLLLLVVIAPLAEELAKGLGVLRVRAQINEMEDGIVYGASAGLGFAAMENLLYGAVAYATEGLAASLMLIAIRSFSSALLHASSTSAFGYGVAKSRLSPEGKGLFAFYILAVFMHGTFNFFASFGELFAGRYGESAALIGFVAAISLALVAVGLAKSAIARHERRRAPYYRG